MIQYHNVKSRKAEDREIRTTICTILRNTEAIGNSTMEYETLTRRTCEHLENIRLTYTYKQIITILDEMIQEGLLYRVSTTEGMCIGLERRSKQ